LKKRRGEILKKKKEEQNAMPYVMNKDVKKKRSGKGGKAGVVARIQRVRGRRGTGRLLKNLGNTPKKRA